MIKRNYGIDLYRIIATFMICVLHIIGYGGLLEANSKGTINYDVIYILEVLGCFAVDGYALITGFNAKEKKLNYSRLIYLWFQVFFYSFIFSILLTILGINKNLNLVTIIQSMFPTTFNAYWYFSAYVPLAILEPFIIRSLNKLDDNDLKCIFIIIILIFCFSGLICDCYTINYGYSFIWLTLLFILGYTIKRLNLFSKWSSKKLFISSIVMLIVSWSTLLIFKTGGLINYNSPTILFNAIFLLVLFSRINTANNFVKVLTPLTFGIYLCQENIIIRDKIIGSFIFINNLNVLAIIPTVFIAATIMFIICAIIDYIRLLLFKLFKIDYLSSKINDLLISQLSRFKQYLFRLFN